MAKHYAVHICNTTVGTEELKGKKLTYDAVRRIVLEAGKFSVFEATATQKHARLFTRLCKDPGLVITKFGFPWTGVKRKRKGNRNG